MCLSQFVALSTKKEFQGLILKNENSLLIKFAKSMLQMVKAVFLLDKICIPNISGHPS